MAEPGEKQMNGPLENHMREIYLIILAKRFVQTVNTWQPYYKDKEVQVRIVARQDSARGLLDEIPEGSAVYYTMQPEPIYQDYDFSIPDIFRQLHVYKAELIQAQNLKTWLEALPMKDVANLPERVVIK